MPVRARIAWILWLTACLSLMVIAPAAAYLDPGTGSVIFQAVIAGAMAASVGIKVFWSRIRQLFTREDPVQEDVAQ